MVLLSTFRCTAACENCCLGCRQDCGRSMTIAQMKRYVDKCLEAYGDTITFLDISGGECMLYPENVEKIIRYGKSKGLFVTILSNCFWATSYAKAEEMGRRLKDAGLDKIVISSGENHSKWVPVENCLHATKMFALLGIDVEYRIEAHGDSDVSRFKFEDDKVFVKLANMNSIGVNIGSWIDVNNRGTAGATNPVKTRDIHFEEESMHGCRMLFTDISISPYGDVFPCCGLASTRIPSFRLGNIEHESVRDIYRRAFTDALKMWILDKGPAAVLKFVLEHSDLAMVQPGPHPCGQCRQIFYDKDILDFLKNNFSLWYDEIRFAGHTDEK